MSCKEILDQAKAKMDKSIIVLQNNMQAIRAGRANPKLLDRITVDYYGTPTPLNQIGNVTVPEARMLVIKPWEKTMLKAIEKAIQTSDLGLNPNNDGEVIRLIFPELNAERRKDLTKQVKKYAEDAKVAMRNIRRDAVDAFKKAQKDGMPEDEAKAGEGEAQKVIDKYSKKLDVMLDAKEKEIMTV